MGERGERAEIAAEAEAEEQRRLDAAAYDFRLAAERQQLLMDMKARRLEAEEVRRPQRPPPHLTSPRITPPHLSLKLSFTHTLSLFLSLIYTYSLSLTLARPLRPTLTSEHSGQSSGRHGRLGAQHRNPKVAPIQTDSLSSQWPYSSVAVNPLPAPEGATRTPCLAGSTQRRSWPSDRPGGRRSTRTRGSVSSRSYGCSAPRETGESTTSI